MVENYGKVVSIERREEFEETLVEYQERREEKRRKRRGEWKNLKIKKSTYKQIRRLSLISRDVCKTIHL